MEYNVSKLIATRGTVVPRGAEETRLARVWLDRARALEGPKQGRSGYSDFRIQDSGFRIQDSGFRIQDSDFVAGQPTPLRSYAH